MGMTEGLDQPHRPLRIQLQGILRHRSRNPRCFGIVYPAIHLSPQRPRKFLPRIRP